MRTSEKTLHAVLYCVLQKPKANNNYQSIKEMKNTKQQRTTHQSLHMKSNGSEIKGESH